MTAPMRDFVPAQEGTELAMPDQNFRAPFRDPAAGLVVTPALALLARTFVFPVPLAISLWLGNVSLRWFALDGRLTPVEIGLVGLTAFTFFWVLLSVATAVLGLMWRPAPRVKVAGAGLEVAILLPMYGEPAAETIGGAVDLLASLEGRDHAHRFSLHVLSDSRAEPAQVAEAEVIAALQAAHPGLRISYRHRAENTDYKTGNLREWVRRAGGAYEAMLVLDADSVMGRDAVLRLADAMAAEPAVGLIQTIPRLLPGRTLWQRLQEFAAQVYGVNLARGFGLWAGTEANFLGHNALIRTRAFAASAGLPHLRGRRPLGGVILSHDFVEAALLRRAGWAVRMMPEADVSFEDTPENLLGYVRRDRRWCQGNMQHLRLLAMPGLHPVSRFHFLQGAMAYLASVWWLCLLILWAIPSESVIRYFGDGNPMIPVWPMMPPVTQGAIAGFVVATLIGPKVLGVLAYLREHGLPRGQRLAFLITIALELVLSVLMAPMLMLHQVRAVLRTFLGFDAGWSPHVSGRPALATLMRFHATETVLGLGLLALSLAGVLTLWVAPVAACLSLAVPLSALVATEAGDWPLFRFSPTGAGAGQSKRVFGREVTT